MKGTLNLYCSPSAHSGNAPSNINKLNFASSKSLVSGSSRSASHAWKPGFNTKLIKRYLLLVYSSGAWTFLETSIPCSAPERIYDSTNLNWIANDIKNWDRHDISHSSSLTREKWKMLRVKSSKHSVPTHPKDPNLYNFECNERSWLALSPRAHRRGSQLENRWEMWCCGLYEEKLKRMKRRKKRSVLVKLIS